MSITLKQIECSIEKVNCNATHSDKSSCWVAEIEHYRDLLLRAVDQMQRRVYMNEAMPSSDKLVSVFGPHTAIIVKGQRDVQYGHKIGLATQADGYVIYLNIDSSNPSDRSLFRPVLNASMNDYGQVPLETVADGGYASHSNVAEVRGIGVDRVARFLEN